jgi:hypothetical protein
MQFVCELALQNARNSVLELQKCKNFLDPPFLPKLSMRVPINHKKLYYNYYTSGKFLTLKFKFHVKSSDIPPPQTSDASQRH